MLLIVIFAPSKYDEGNQIAGASVWIAQGVSPAHDDGF